MTKRFGVELEITRLMLKVGLMCSRLKRFDEAEQINRALIAYREDLPHPRTNLALTWMCQNRWREAEHALEVVRDAFPNDQLAKALLGLVHRESGRVGWEQLPQEVIEDGRDESAISLAQMTLDYAAASRAGEGDAHNHILYTQRVYA